MRLGVGMAIPSSKQVHFSELSDPGPKACIGYESAQKTLDFNLRHAIHPVLNVPNRDSVIVNNALGISIYMNNAKGLILVISKS